MKVKGITIHNSNSDKSAKELFDYLKEIKRPNLTHYLIDENEIINTWDVSECASHTGKGYDFGNLYTIAIEICRSKCDISLYLKAEDNAIKFIKKLMKKYKLSYADIYFHEDFNENFRCPHKIFEIYKNKENFIEHIKGE